MSNMITVVLEDNVDQERVNTITNAISMVQGVLSAQANQADSGSDYVVGIRIRAELCGKLFEVLLP